MLGLLFVACKDKVYQRYYVYQPVYTDYETFRQPPQLKPAQAISETGQIYYKDNYLYVVENDKGIHIIDNNNPSSPVNVGFLEIMGCTGLAIRENYLYANSFIDLVVMDISDHNHPVEAGRVEDAFPLAIPVCDKNYPVGEIDKNLGVVTAWNVEKVKEKIEYNGYYWTNCWNCVYETDVAGSNIMYDASSGTASSGTAGSITKFALIDDFLYVIDGFKLMPFGIMNPVEPAALDGVGVWQDVETLFPYKNYLFMGTPSGMLIYGTENPLSPNYIGQLTHARGCDPVVVQDDFAYVTVRSGGPCGGAVNELDVIHVADMYNPVLVKTFDMKNPYGLGIDGSTLFVCDGKDGLKIYDATDPSVCGDHLQKSFKNIQATDIIPLGNRAILIGDDGIYQYDYTDVSDVKLLSKIKF